jgi:hypothetical protein
MTFTVVWQPGALNRLAELWMAHPKKEAFARATDFIDATLKLAPLEHGKEREGGHRTLIVLPVGVEFFVMLDDRMVTVVDVWQIEDDDE